MNFFLRLFKRFETIGILHSVRKIAGNNRKNKLFVFAVVNNDSPARVLVCIRNFANRRSKNRFRIVIMILKRLWISIISAIILENRKLKNCRD